jgi:2-dehydro-3-deoxy-D-arabinonate dehydratase
MQLTRHQTRQGARWATDGAFLPPSLTLSTLLELRCDVMLQLLTTLPRDERANDELFAPIDPLQEVWAAGVTYLRSRDARRVESTVANVYDRCTMPRAPNFFSRRRGGASSEPACRFVFALTAAGVCQSRNQ